MAELGTELLERAAKHVDSLYTEYDPKCDVYRRIATKSWNTWENKQDNRVINDISNIGVGETHVNCEVWIPRLFINIFPYRMFYDFDSTNMAKEPVKKFYRKQLDKMNYEQKNEPGMRAFVVEGTVWYKLYLDMARKERVEYEFKEVENFSENPMIRMIQEATTKITGQPPMKVVKTKKYFNEPFNSPQIRLIPSERMVYDTEIENQDDMSWLMEKVDIRPSDIMKKEKNADGKGVYINYDLIQEKILDKLNDVDKDIDAHIQCVEYWGLFDYNEDGKPIQCIITKPVGQKFVIRCEKNPYKFKKPPYVTDRFLKVKGRFPGLGIPELISRPQEELDAKRNLVAAAETMALYNEIVLGANVKADKGAFEKPRPGKIIKLKSGTVDDIKNMPINVEIQGAMALEAVTKSDMQRMSKVSPTQQGQVKGGETTAFEVSSALRESNQSIKFVIESYTLNIIEKSLAMVQDMNDQYLPDNETYEVDGQTIRSIDIKQIGKFKVLGVNNLEHEALNYKTAVDIYTAIMQTPQVQGKDGRLYPTNQKLALEDLLTAYKKQNVSEYIGQEPTQGGGMGTGGGGESSSGESTVDKVKNSIQGMFKPKKPGG